MLVRLVLKGVRPRGTAFAQEQELRFSLDTGEKLRLSPVQDLRVEADLDDPTSGGAWTCQTVFDDVALTPLAKGHMLTAWQLVRGLDSWSGSAAERSPDIIEGDEVTLFAKTSKAVAGIG
jgi:hypothetical protein